MDDLAQWMAFMKHYLKTSVQRLRACSWWRPRPRPRPGSGRRPCCARRRAAGEGRPGPPRPAPARSTGLKARSVAFVVFLKHGDDNVCIHAKMEELYYPHRSIKMFVIFVGKISIKVRLVTFGHSRPGEILRDCSYFWQDEQIKPRKNCWPQNFRDEKLRFCCFSAPRFR